MSNQDQPDDDGKMVLGHDAVAGYRPAFLIAITIGLLYLCFIFYKTL